VYAGVSRKRVREVCELIVKEMLELGSTLTDDELDKAKRHLKGNMILALESTNSRMNNIARQEMYYGRYISPDEIIKSVDRVRLAEIQALSERLIARDRFSATAFGPMEKDVLDSVF
jgi:predicted Zn-dependent peptidase